MEPQIYIAPGPFELETGHTLPELRIAYHTYGTLNAAKDNVAWVCHALTANSDVADWWPHTVEAGRFLDPARHFVVCVNIIGSHYGTTRAAGGADWSRRSAASRPGRWWSASRPTSSSRPPRCAACTP